MRKNLMILAAAMMFSAVVFAQNAETISVAGAPNGKFMANADYEIEGQVVDGLKEGTWIEYFGGDKFLPRRVINFKRGLKNGMYLEFDNTGSLIKQAEYQDDQLINGRVCCWYRGGRLSKMNTYKNGELDGRQITCYEKGGIQEESNYVNGKRDGISTWYDENGNKMMTIEYKGGLFDGKQETFYTSGQIKSSKMFKANKLNGDAREFFESGAVKSEATYKDGKLSGKMKDYERKDYRPAPGNANGSKN